MASLNLEYRNFFEILVFGKNERTKNIQYKVSYQAFCRLVSSFRFGTPYYQKSTRVLNSCGYRKILYANRRILYFQSVFTNANIKAHNKNFDQINQKTKNAIVGAHKDPRN